MLPGTAPSLLTWHLHPGCEHRTSATLETESPLAWSQIIKIMAFHWKSFLESQFASEPVTSVWIWISCYTERGCLCLLNLREECKGGKVWKKDQTAAVHDKRAVDAQKPCPTSGLLHTAATLQSGTSHLLWGEEGMKMRNVSCFKDKVHGHILWAEELGCLENKANSTFLFTDSPEVNSVLRLHYHYYCLSSQATLILSLFLIKEREQPHYRQHTILLSPLRTWKNFSAEWGK